MWSMLFKISWRFWTKFLWFAMSWPEVPNWWAHSGSCWALWHVLPGDGLPHRFMGTKKVRCLHEETSSYQFNRDTVLPAKFVLVALESKVTNISERRYGTKFEVMRAFQTSKSLGRLKTAHEDLALPIAFRSHKEMRHWVLPSLKFFYHLASIGSCANAIRSKEKQVLHGGCHAVWRFTNLQLCRCHLPHCMESLRRWRPSKSSLELNSKRPGTWPEILAASCMVLSAIQQNWQRRKIRSLCCLASG